ncbi:hypothetical protein ICM05_03910 [Leucobacter sp. cx-42]|uniref:hypothetical protein n=1 Tax=unclassified Leucobacter TaxID=2621730 RepID=UPI00165D3C5A|nr:MULTISPECIES: hypothetical protein [unclassified Leucobacter]MBC9953797.1 hypothetical protein [Leucobacter sp. cx-42]
MQDREDAPKRIERDDEPFVFEPEPEPQIGIQHEEFTGPLKWYRILGVSIAIFLLVSAVVAIPLALHFANKTEYQSDLESLTKIRTTIANNEATRDAANELLGASHEEASKLAVDLERWGSANATALGKEEAKALAKSGKELQASLAEVKPASDGADLTAALNALRADEAEFAAADLPASVIDWSADQAANVLGVLPVTEVEVEFTENYSKDKLEKLRTALDEAKAEEKTSLADSNAAVEEVRALSKTVQAARPALIAAAESTLSKVTGLKAAYANGDIKPVEAAAKHAAELSADTQATAAELHVAMGKYFAAVNALAAEHAAK